MWPLEVILSTLPLSPNSKQGEFAEGLVQWSLDVPEDTDTAASLGNLFQYLITFTVKIFLMFIRYM